MTTMTPRKNPLRPCHEGIKFVNDEPTCWHKKPMVRIPNGFWACKYKPGEGSCKRYLRFDEVDKIKPLLPHEAAQTPRTPQTPYKQQSITRFLLPTPSTDGKSESRAKPDDQNKETDPTRPPVTPTRRTAPSAGTEPAVASGSTTVDRKRPISPDTPDNSPWKKQSRLRSANDPVRLLFPPTPYKRAANESHPDENGPRYFMAEHEFGKKSSQEHASSQTSDAGSGTSVRGVARVPLGHADSNRV